VTVLLGDCLAVLPTLAAESVDAIVCDPPYGLSFMGKNWDHGIPGVAFWEAALRVAKPGAHLVAFGGTRTFHRLACAIEDAGWEIRDTLMWVYGSGFPKSLDVSKALDKRGGADIGWFGPWLRQERQRRGLSSNDLGKHFPSKTGGPTGCVRNWELGLNIPTPDQFNLLCDVLGLSFARIEEAERAVLETRRESGKRQVTILGTEAKDYDVTAPACDAAKQWAGWGTALKPAYEPIILARKPLSPQEDLAILAPTTKGELWRVGSYAETGTSLYGWLRASGFWSIGGLLSNTLDALSEHASKCTTETAFALTTDLRILKSSLSKITPDAITEAASPTSGAESSGLRRVFPEAS
jgi:hypothetical protein